MSLRVKMTKRDALNQPEWLEDSFVNQEVTFDNMTFHYGPNQTRSFADDGVGLGFRLTASGIVSDNVPFDAAA